MRRKRLKHAADTLCDIFVGWRLANSFQELERLGTGRLLIDVMTPACTFDGASVSPLSIAVELHHWLCRDLLTHSIPLESLGSAVLDAHLVLSTVVPIERVTSDHYFDADGRSARKRDYYRLEIDCSSRIATDDAVYESSKTSIEEWPAGWPSV